MSRVDDVLDETKLRARTGGFVISKRKNPGLHVSIWMGVKVSGLEQRY